MLDGTVAATAEKELAEKDAKKVKGVMGVHNGLSLEQSLRRARTKGLG